MEPKLAIGQKQIHTRIQALNFVDVLTKINRVDCQSTLANGVIVQVSGEVSNAGQPLRLFVQTFILAPLAPKVYYVHNDIFHYQDFRSNINKATIEGAAKMENVRVDSTQQLSAKASNTEMQSPFQQKTSSMDQQQQQMSLPPQQQQSSHQQKSPLRPEEYIAEQQQQQQDKTIAERKQTNTINYIGE